MIEEAIRSGQRAASKLSSWQLKPMELNRRKWLLVKHAWVSEMTRSYAALIVALGCEGKERAGSKPIVQELAEF